MREVLTFPTSAVYVCGTTGVARGNLNWVLVGFTVIVVENESDLFSVGAEEDVGIILSNMLCIVGRTTLKRATRHQRLHLNLHKMSIENCVIIHPAVHAQVQAQNITYATFT